MKLSYSRIAFLLCTYTGFGLLSFHWVILGREIAGFFVLLFMVCMTLLRWRLSSMRLSVVLDVVVCAVFAPMALGVSLFSAMYYRVYWAVLGVVFIGVFGFEFEVVGFAGVAGLAGSFLGLWEREQKLRTVRQDQETERYYELEDLQKDLLSATARIEKMTLVSERARISREIHDKAGHEIVAAYMSLQAARGILEDLDRELLELYDAALERLSAGLERIREAVHNLDTVRALGVETLKEACNRFPIKVDFQIFGNTNHVPIHIWEILDTCISETLTNAAKHALGMGVKVALDVTPYIIRLSVENQGLSVVGKKKTPMGSGLRNLRRRAEAVGGSLTVDMGAVFRVVCVIPLVQSR